ncbi:MAG: hypothetical protein R3A80_10670 [Bdellovibrionota bacterium]
MSKILTLFFVFSVLSFAKAEEKKGDTGDGFAKAKARSLSMMEERIKALETTKACIKGAANREALKKCHEAARAAQKNMRDDRKDMRKERREERKGKRSSRREERRGKRGNDAPPPPPPENEDEGEE